MNRTNNVTQEPLMEALATVPAADRDTLLKLWAELYDLPAPKISTAMLRQALAYKIQERQHGGLKPVVRRFLEKDTVCTGTIVPVIVKPGTRLVRQWRGTTYEVIVIPDGVLLDGLHLSSLTEAAYRITGSKWSGPRFFGLVKGGHGDRRKTI